MKFLITEKKIQLPLTEAEKADLQRRIEEACKNDKSHIERLSN